MESVAGWFNPGNTCSSCDKAGENVDNPQLNAHDPTSSHGWFLWFFGTYYQNFRGLLFGLLIFLSHHAALGSLLFCILYAKCCASGCILLLFPHLIPCDYGPHGMYHSDPGLQFIQLNWSEGMLVRVQTFYLDYLNSWYVVNSYCAYHCWLKKKKSTIMHDSNHVSIIWKHFINQYWNPSRRIKTYTDSTTHRVRLGSLTMTINEW